MLSFSYQVQKKRAFTANKNDTGGTTCGLNNRDLIAIKIINHKVKFKSPRNLACEEGNCDNRMEQEVN